VPARADLARLLPALSDAIGGPLPAVIVADRWRLSRHVFTTLRDVEDHKARLRLEYGACEVVQVAQDAADPEWQFRVPNPAVWQDGGDVAQLDALHEIDGADVSAAEVAADAENEYVLALVRQYGRPERAA
jgi:hypothetical protein